MSLGLSLIARDEEEALPALLQSVEGAFDQVVLVDTGSRDATIELFGSWVAEEADRNPHFSSRVAAFDWTGDFAAARNFADSLLTTEWKVWADADDEIRGAERLRQLAAAAPADVVAFTAGYRTGQSGTGQPLSYVWRARLVRAGHGTWEGRVHELQQVQGRTVEIAPTEVEWIHRRDYQNSIATLERNLEILESWLCEEPSNAHVVRLLAEACAVGGRRQEALDHYARFLTLRPEWGPARAQVHRHAGVLLMALGRPEEALHCAREALLAVPSWTDSYLTLAEAHLQLGDPAMAIQWAQVVLRLGPPKTELVIKPLDYTLQPRMLIAAALRKVGRSEDALSVAREALSCLGDQPATPLGTAARAPGKATQL